MRRLRTLFTLTAVLTVAGLAPTLPAQAAPTSSTATVSPASPTGTNGFYRDPVTVTFSATDATNGVQRIEYQLGSTAPFQTAVSASAPYPATLSGSVQITQNGTIAIGYRAVGGDGSVEAVHTTTVRIDTVPPVVNWPVVNGHIGHTATLIPNRTDPSPGSGGVFLFKMFIDGKEVTPLPVSTSDLAVGGHTIGVVASDSAGNAARYDQTFVVTTSFGDLGTLLSRFAAAGTVPSDLAASLQSTLDQANSLATAGDVHQAVAALNQFVGAAQDGLAPGAVRDTLVGDARYLIEQVTGTLPAEPPTGTTVSPAVGPSPIPVPAVSPSTNYPGATFRVLYFSLTKGFRHDHIPDTAALVERWGQQYGFNVDVWDPQLGSGSMPSTPFTSAADLAKYSTIIFSSPVDGTNPGSQPPADALTASELTAFRGYIEAGGGYVGLHGAADSMHNIPWYRDVVGAWFTNHPGGQNGEGTCGSCINVQVNTEDSSAPFTAHLPSTWLTIDELYNFDHNPRAEVHTLLSLNEASYQRSLNSGNAATNPLTLMGGDHPISWCQQYDNGREFSLILGHDRAQYYRDSYTTMILQGIRWTAGLIEANCSTFRQTRTLVATAATGGTLTQQAATSADALLASATNSYLAHDYNAAKADLNQVMAIAADPSSGEAATRTELGRQADQLRTWMDTLKHQ
ncbi:MAG: ThuA domain-containing protein [Micromonosporaceae bacterium]|nr:ThuA domain-containing protein [Micromonosporaceae bacterium]